jgi:hypothetical protein
MPARPSHTSAIIIALGIVIAAILAPVAATAAGQLVEISSASGRKADVTRAEQLQVAEASAHQFVHDTASFVGTSCGTILAAPATKAVVIKTATVSFTSIIGTGLHNLTFFEPGEPCGSQMTTLPVTSISIHEVDFGAGLVIPAGGSLSAYSQGATVQVTVFGYKVPPAAAPAG